jgi:hypothetical protein
VSLIGELDLKNFLKSEPSIRADELSSSTNGIGIDAKEALAVLWVLDVGDVEGSPTSFTLDVAIQDSDDNSTFAAAKDESGNPIAFAQITAANQHVTLMDKLHASEAASGARPSKRYRRAVATISFAGGTSPNIAVSCHAIIVRRNLRSV